MNSFDSSIYLKVLTDYGFEETSEISESSIVLINTCAVRDKSVQKAASCIGEARHLKQEKPNLIICVLGCASELLKDSSHKKKVDYFCGALNSSQADSSFYKLLDDKGFKYKPVSSHSLQLTSKTSHFIPIIFGCNSFCTYCIVPYVRGREKSRPFEDIKREIIQAVSEGATEIILLGQNVNCYGKDFLEKTDFPSLLDKIAIIPGIKRLDFLTSHPREFNKNLLQVMKNHKNIVHRFHFPIQNGDNDILKRMRRGYTVEEYLEKISWIRDIFPIASITTDIIVGFPGESEEAFQNTLELINTAKFDSIYGAVYSPRPLTKASEYADRVPLNVGKERLNKVLEIQKNITRSNILRFQNTNSSVYVIENSNPDSITGKTWEDRLISFKPLDELPKIGQVVEVNVEYIENFKLFGKQIKNGNQ
ncbi:MAG: tRNA (N6-isopentenyl adenosine(37)-C2)-methylthiotransferase MiaB [Caldisericia bacterium]|nr:tRNA (N6-isopentenyl adenosine(37)-C2)-methylthiotransferase MiaB [Caldisericia bacterium]